MWPHDLLAWLGREDLDRILREGEGFAGMDMWSVLAVLSGVPVTFRLKEIKCLGGPRCYGGCR